MLGGTEYVAEACQETLEALGHQATVHLTPNLADIPHQDQTWLICTSTHGAGDYPDNIQAFVADLQQSDLDLIHTPFIALGTGDTSYDTYCLAAKNIVNLLKSMGSKELLPLKTLDVSQDIDPEAEAQAWISSHKDQLS